MVSNRKLYKPPFPASSSLEKLWVCTLGEDGNISSLLWSTRDTLVCTFVFFFYGTLQFCYYQGCVRARVRISVSSFVTSVNSVSIELFVTRPKYENLRNHFRNHPICKKRLLGVFGIYRLETIISRVTFRRSSVSTKKKTKPYFMR